MSQSMRACEVHRQFVSLLKRTPRCRKCHSGPSSARGDSSLLTRDFIRRALYGEVGYFVTRDVVYAPEAPLPFTQLLGASEYRSVLAKQYSDSPHGWLTPSTIFAPWYSRALARYVLMSWLAAGGKTPLIVYELGGGTGHGGAHFCAAIREFSSKAYAALQYTLVEISPTLQQRQETTLRAAGHSAAVARSVIGDATDLRGAGVVYNGACYVIACELLDNLPHDKAVLLKSSLDQPAVWHETVVVNRGTTSDGRPILAEDFRPLEDSTIDAALDVVADRATGVLCNGESAKASSTSVLSTFTASIVSALPSWMGGNRAPILPPSPAGLVAALYVPSGLMALFASIVDALPLARLVLADFDQLPPPNVDRARAAVEDAEVIVYAAAAPSTCPLVASKDSTTRLTVDHATYLHPRHGTADIFFPTNFDVAVRALKTVIRHDEAAGVAGKVTSISGIASREVRSARALSELPRHRASTNDSRNGHLLRGVGLAGDGPRHISSATFLSTFGEVARTQTLTGYNPMLEDFGNTRFLLT